MLVGDGAFQMTGWELDDCRRYGLDPIVLVFNSASWQMLRALQPVSQFNELDSWDFAGMAAGLGGDGVHARTCRAPRDALAHAVSRRGRFQRIGIQLPGDVLYQTLQRYVTGVKGLSMTASPIAE